MKIMRIIKIVWKQFYNKAIVKSVPENDIKDLSRKQE